jgi:Na+-driven multidrug efflux pump
MSTVESVGVERRTRGAGGRDGDSLWALLREAIRGSPQDYTEGPLNRAVFLLALPMVLEMGMESVFGIVDVFFVGRLGPSAVAAVGLTESFLTVVYSLGLGLAMATTALVARRIGEKDAEDAARTAVQAIVIGLGAAVPFAVVGALWSRELLQLMGAPASVVQTGWGYTAWMLGGNASILLLFLINAVFRGAGDATIAMRSLWLANAFNIVLDPCLIFGLGPFPALGVTGAAVATTIGLVRILTPFGATALAGYTIALRVIIVALLPAWGLSNAVATLVGQNLGAGKPERAERSAWIAGGYNMAFLLGVMALFLWKAEPLIALFSSDPAVQRMGALCLRVVSYGYGFYAWGMVLVQAFNGAGDTVTPTWINFFCYWLFQIPIAWLLARSLGQGPLGVFLAITLAESVIAVVGLLVFRRGAWKRKVV